MQSKVNFILKWSPLQREVVRNCKVVIGMEWAMTALLIIFVKEKTAIPLPPLDPVTLSWGRQLHA